MPIVDPEVLEMQPPSAEWSTEREHLVARVRAATSFCRRYEGVYEQLQQSFDLWGTIEANMLRLDSIGPRFFDGVDAIHRSRAFVEGLEHEMRQIEAMGPAVDRPPSPAVVAVRHTAAPPPRPAGRDIDDDPAPYTGQYL